MRKLILLMLSVILLSISTVTSQPQDTTCPVTDNVSIEELIQNCAFTATNQLCYGSGTVSVDGISGDPGNIVPLDGVSMISTSSNGSEPGIAVMRLQANYENPSDYVTMIAIGDVEITDVSSEIPDYAITVTAKNNMNVRGGPSTNYPIVGTLSGSESIYADGQNEQGDWLRIRLEDGLSGWVSGSLVSTNEISVLLPKVSGASDNPFQSFYIVTTTTDPNCENQGLLIQGPDSDQIAILRVNELSLEIEGDAFVNAKHDSLTTVSSLEGNTIARNSQNTVLVPGGAMAEISSAGLTVIPLDSETRVTIESFVGGLVAQTLTAEQIREQTSEWYASKAPTSGNYSVRTLRWDDTCGRPLPRSDNQNTSGGSVAYYSRITSDGGWLLCQNPECIPSLNGDGAVAIAIEPGTYKYDLVAQGLIPQHIDSHIASLAILSVINESRFTVVNWATQTECLIAVYNEMNLIEPFDETDQIILLSPDSTPTAIPSILKCPLGIGPDGIVAGDYPPEKLTQEQRQWLYEIFGNAGTAAEGYGGERCGQAYDSAQDNYVAMICSRGDIGPGGITASDYNPADLSQEQRQWLFELFGNIGTAPEGYGGERCPGEDTKTAYDVFVAQICSADYVGPNGMRAGSYDPTTLTQEERQWLYEIFGNTGEAPVGYGGERCPDQTENLPEPDRTGTEGETTELPQCPEGVGEPGTFDPTTLTQEQRDELYWAFGHSGQAPVGYGGEACQGGEMTLPSFTDDTDISDTLEDQSESTDGTSSEDSSGTVLGASTTADTETLFWEYWLNNIVGITNGITETIVNLSGDFSGTVFSFFNGLLDFKPIGEAIIYFRDVTEPAQRAVYLECLNSSYSGEDSESLKEAITNAVFWTCNPDALGDKPSFQDATCKRGATWDDLSYEVKSSDAFWYNFTLESSGSAGILYRGLDTVYFGSECQDSLISIFKK